MPVKRRNSKRRVDHRAEIEAWSGLFDCGIDFFDDLEPFGYVTDNERTEAAPEAWRRLGRQFLDIVAAGEWPWRKSRPWALDQFGEPPHAR
jgi:hypothetical protein